MTHYMIEQTTSGHCFGIWSAESEEQAILAMLEHAGCADDPDIGLQAREVEVRGKCTRCDEDLYVLTYLGRHNEETVEKWCKNCGNLSNATT